MLVKPGQTLPASPAVNSISCWPNRADHGQRGTKHTPLSCKIQFVGTKKCLGVGDTFQHFHVGGMLHGVRNVRHRPSRDPAGWAQTPTTALAAQVPSAALFSTHPGGNGLCPFSLGPIPTHTQLTGEKPPQFPAQCTSNPPLLSFHPGFNLLIQLRFFSFSLLGICNLFNQTCSCSSPFSVGYSLFFSNNKLISLHWEGKSKFPTGPTSLCLLSQITQDDHQKTEC